MLLLATLMVYTTVPCSSVWAYQHVAKPETQLEEFSARWTALSFSWLMCFDLIPWSTCPDYPCGTTLLLNPQGIHLSWLFLFNRTLLPTRQLLLGMYCITSEPILGLLSLRPVFVLGSWPMHLPPLVLAFSTDTVHGLIWLASLIKSITCLKDEVTSVLSESSLMLMKYVTMFRQGG